MHLPRCFPWSRALPPIALCLVASACSDRGAPISTAAPELVIEVPNGTSALDFGAPLVGETQAQTIKLIAKSRTPVHISRVTVDENDPNLEFSADQVGPVDWTLKQDEVKEISITLKPSDTLPDRGRLCVDSDDLASPTCVTLGSVVRGKARLCGCVEDGSGHLGCAIEGQELKFVAPALNDPAVARRVLLTNCGDGNQPLALLSAADVGFDVADPALRLRVYDGAAGATPTSFPALLQAGSQALPARVVSAEVTFQPQDLSVNHATQLCVSWFSDGAAQRSCLKVSAGTAVCPAGRKDLDGSPTNGCECTVGAEICDGVDNDCNGLVDDVDVDGDRFYACPTWATMDCDDHDGAAHLGAREICNGVDDNCNGLVDEGTTTSYVLDTDHDFYGKPGSDREACAVPPPNYLARSSILGWDCNDADPMMNPGVRETCNGLDDNCNGFIDEGVTNTYYQDLDRDRFVNAAATAEGCAPPDDAGTWIRKGTQDGFDCNDSSKAIKPDAGEVCNKVDDNCNGLIDDGLTMYDVYPDGDGDGFQSANATRYSSCDVPLGYTIGRDAGSGLTALDCDDSNSSVYPGAPELCDGILNNCQRTVPDQTCPRVCEGAWPVSLGTSGGNAVLAQLDSDNELEIVVFTSTGIQVLNNDGSLLWARTTGAHAWSRPTLGDVNLDGRMEVVYASNEAAPGNGTIFVLKGSDGTVLASYPGGSEYAWGGGRVSVVDVDNDGDMDLVPEPNGTTGRILFLDKTLALVKAVTYSVPSPQSFNWAQPVVMDRDGDGQVEVGLGTGNWNCVAGTNCLYRFNVFGLDGGLLNDPSTSFRPSFADTGFMTYYAPVLADWDGDGTSELVTPVANRSGGGSGSYVFALDGGAAVTVDGGVIPWQNTLNPRTAAPVSAGKLTTGSLTLASGPVVDVDGDGVFEQIVGGAGLRVLSSSGALLPGYPLGVSASSPTIGDADLDGQLDLLYFDSASQSLNCVSLGSNTWKPDSVLSLGNLGWSQGAFETNALDPYEPNDPGIAVGRPAPDPVADATLSWTTAPTRYRAMPLAPFQLSTNVGGVVNREVRGLIGAKGDRDYFWLDGYRLLIANLFVSSGAPVNYDLYVHFFDKTSGNYKGSRSSTGAGNESISCDSAASNPCPVGSNLPFRAIVEVRPKDPTRDFGPWPYRLSVSGF